MRFVLLEVFNAGGVFGIQHKPVGEDDFHAVDGAIRVLRRPAAHAAGVIGRDAADFTGIDRRRVRADFALERRKVFVGIGANHARLKEDFVAILEDLVTTPIVGQCNQYRIGHRLTRQAGACRAKGEVNAEFTAAFNGKNHFVE